MFKEINRQNVGGMWFDDDKDCESLKVAGESNMAGLDFAVLNLEALLLAANGVLLSCSLNELNCL